MAPNIPGGPDYPIAPHLGTFNNTSSYVGGGGSREEEWGWVGVARRGGVAEGGRESREDGDGGAGGGEGVGQM